MISLIKIFGITNLVKLLRSIFFQGHSVVGLMLRPSSTFIFQTFSRVMFSYGFILSLLFWSWGPGLSASATLRPCFLTGILVELITSGHETMLYSNERYKHLWFMSTIKYRLHKTSFASIQEEFSHTAKLSVILSNMRLCLTSDG